MDSIKLVLLPLLGILYFFCTFKKFLEVKYLGMESDQLSHSLCCFVRE